MKFDQQIRFDNDKSKVYEHVLQPPDYSVSYWVPLHIFH